jgi:aspartyl-tRNA(Asn)/glutamyl-tRNA(Gln) amidotransferase subunit A
MTDLSMLGAAELVAGYRSGQFTPLDATRAALDAIGVHNPRVNAFVLVDEEVALGMAADSTNRYAAGTTLGPADGIPVSIKDMFLTKGWPTLRGSTLSDAAGPWDEDAPAAARLRESGTVFLGKNTTPEFAWKGVTDSERHGVTGNPWGAELTSGGSSGGSATAVGLGMGTWSVGTDGGGSVRIPASFTGTVAFKPTYGLIPMYPSSPYGTLAHAGPMTRTVSDAAMMLDILARPDARDWSALPSPEGSFLDGLDGGVEGLSVAFSPDLGFGTNDADVDAAVRQAAQVLSDAGARVEEVDLGISDPVDAFHLLWFTGAAKVLESYGDDALGRVDPGLAAAITEFGITPTASDYLDAMAVRMSLGRRFGALHDTHDVLLCPTMPISAFPAGQPSPDGWPSQLWTSWTPYTYLFNLTQQPAVSLPCGLTGDHRPIGLQVVGPRHGDRIVLRVAHAYERLTDWHQKVPTLLDAAH